VTTSGSNYTDVETATDAKTAVAEILAGMPLRAGAA